VSDEQGPQRIEKKGKRYYSKPKREKHPTAALVPYALDALKMMFAVNGDGPSVTTVLGALAKPALISWAARNERKMISALAAQLYGRLYKLTDEPVSPEKFEEMVNEQAGKGAHLKLLAKASNVGTEVHARIEWQFKGELGYERDTFNPPKLTTPQAERAFKRWTEWRVQVKLRPIAIEKKLYSTTFGFGGTLDLLAEVDVPDAVSGQDARDVLTTKRNMVVIDFKTGKHIYSEAYLQNVAYRMAIAEEGIRTDGGIIVRLPKYEDDPEFDAQPVPDDPTLGPTFLALLVVYKWWGKDHDRKSAKRTSTPTGTTP
jgi:hypothetical protein